MTPHEREKYVTGLIGKPWVANAKGPDAFDCYSLAREIQRAIFDRVMPEVAIPNEPTWSYLIREIDSHPERTRWTLLEHVVGTSIRDGAIVLMAAVRHPAHMGVWLYPERGVIHCNRPAGVTFDSLLDLRAQGWQRLRFYEPHA